MTRMDAKILASAACVPENPVTNEDLSQFLDTSDEWIQTRTGIKERRIAVAETTASLALRVAEQLLDQADICATELDFILVATMTSDYQTPSVACLVQGAISATSAYAFDISAACAGFVYAFAMGQKLIQTGAKRGIVIGGDTMSQIIDWDDRSTAVLFGDGAGGVLLEASEEAHFLLEDLQADGARAKALTAGYREGEKIQPLQMQGREIFQFATNDVYQQLMAAYEAFPHIDYFLLHQANARLIQKIAQKMVLPETMFLQNVAQYGNTSAGSIPLLLAEAVASGTLILGSGQTVALAGFGGGLTSGVVVIKL